MTDSCPRIRPVALGAVRRGDELLVIEVPDPNEDDPFYRLPGGGIEFGERAADAVEREFDEAFALTLTTVERVGVCEDVFAFDGERCHEHRWIFAASIHEEWPYDRDTFTGYERSVDEPITATWKAIDDLASPEPTFFDDVVLDLLFDATPDPSDGKTQE